MNRKIYNVFKYFLYCILGLIVIKKVEDIIVYFAIFYEKFVHNLPLIWNPIDTVILQNRIILLLLIYIIYKLFFSKKSK